MLWHWQVAKQGGAEHNEIWFSDVPRTMAMCWFSRRKRSFRAEICRDFRSEMGPTFDKPKIHQIDLAQCGKKWDAERPEMATAKDRPLLSPLIGAEGALHRTIWVERCWPDTS